MSLLMSVTTFLRRTFAVSVLALLTAIVVLPTQPAAASTPAEEELTFLQKLNDERSSRGLARLVLDTKLAPTARTWSGYMASHNTLSHDPNLARIASQVEPNWRAVGENVGVGYSVSSLHSAFMGSAGHRANILKATYNRVGIGVVHSGGKIWVTVRFLQGPAISGITGTPPPPPPAPRAVLTGDFNGDGRDDLLTYNPGSTGDELWFGRSDGSMSKQAVSVNGTFRPVAGDFDGDHRTDILWYAPGTAADYLWEWDGDSWVSRSYPINGSYVPLVGDFDGDHVSDLLWYAPGLAADFYWYGSTSGSFTSVPTTINGKYTPTVGDLDGNGGDDLFWYAAGSAKDFVWYSVLRRGAFTSVATTVNGSYWVFTGDFDGSGTEDLFWYAPGTGQDSVWYTNHTRGSYASSARTVNGAYLPGAGDFNGNGADDVVWFSPNSASGDAVWLGALGSRGYSSSSIHG
jgi:uncharacterized protein YkwD